MNLEIKFRAFDKARKEMFFLPVIDVENKNWLQIDKTGINVGTKNGLLSGNEFELMQFTGFVDKKGNDIYKGDILRFDFHSKSYEVIWYDGAYYLRNGNQNARLSTTSLSGYYVVGNVFENPEMLLVTQADA
jgi:uncharacterized phage protein (TIGR01671 family)